MEKKLIIGLGNPGKKYAKTRHNVGFMVLDALAEKYAVKFGLKKKLQAEMAEIIHNSSQPPLWKRGGAPSLLQREGEGELLLLAKPQTFMNDSGQAIRKLYTTYKILNTDLLIVHDEIDLPFGTLKLYRPGGSSAGHKGVDSVIQVLGSGFTRLRIGIENRKEYRIPETEDYVLQNFTAEETKKLKDAIIPDAIEQIDKFLISN